MNPSNLIARAIRNTDPEEPAPIPAAHDHSVPIRAAHSSPLDHDRDLEASSQDYIPDGEPHQLIEDIHHLRVALAQLLARETGQDIHHFQGPVVDNARLCAIADNIWNHRRWSA